MIQKVITTGSAGLQTSEQLYPWQCATDFFNATTHVIMPKMKLISVNIEGDRHLHTVVPFLEREQADVLCLQEVFEDTASTLAGETYVHAFLPMALKERGGELVITGVALLVRNTLGTTFETLYYHTTPGELCVLERDDQEHTVRHGIVFASIKEQEKTYRIGTTHFTWVERGEVVSVVQEQHMDNLLMLVAEKQPHIVCGDFNIPRHHNYLYEKLTECYKDEIPSEYTSSLDKNLHRHGIDSDKAHLFEEFMVDYIFSQPPYTVTNVRLEFDISDHAAVIGEVNM
jgi:endonuclease/exonuclease/phosphatase family metal-dependent hydrolase